MNKRRLSLHLRRFTLVSLLVMLALAACNVPEAGKTTSSPPAEERTEPTPSPSPTPTTKPPMTLVVCTAGLPDSLFPYDGVHTPVKENILAMIQDEPFDHVEGELVPVIVEKVPTLSDGDLLLEPVTVLRGQTVVDARGELVVLKPGVTVRPSGCRQSDCAITWDGEVSLEMDRMVLTFQLVDGLTWSDGTPVTAADSVFSYRLASAPDTPGLQWQEARTDSYTAASEQIIEWVGKPGFTTADIEGFFWTPLPSHKFGEELDWDSLAADDQLGRMPLSYGPFVLSSWEATTLRLERNPYYFRANDGLPLLDKITVQVIEEGTEGALAGLESGSCDVLDSSFRLENDSETLASLQDNGRFDVQVSQGDSWEQLVFGIQPASYDEHYNPIYGDRPDIFGDVRTRQAFAACLNREAMLNNGLAGLTSLWPSFVSPTGSQLSEGSSFAYDPAVGIQLLDQVGWRDHDLDPQTPLQAWDVANVPAGTFLSVELFISHSQLHQDLAEVVRESLGGCGIEVNLVPLSAGELYAPGPEGPIFGRLFDLAFISWQSSPEPDCSLYQSWRIPAAENQWIGTNIAGYSNAAFDAACSDAILPLPDSSAPALLAAETGFVASMPAIPLFSYPSVLVVRLGDCERESGHGEESFFNVIESFAGEINCP